MGFIISGICNALQDVSLFYSQHLMVKLCCYRSIACHVAEAFVRCRCMDTVDFASLANAFLADLLLRISQKVAASDV